MKRCPTCDKTFDDNMRFCQADGTPLVDEVPVDPYKTMIATPADFAAAKDAASQSDDVLDLPASDPAKTMFASEEEIRAEMAAHDRADEQVIDIPPLAEPPPQFSEPTPPPSPFSSPGDIGSMTTPPIPSPFEEKPSTYEAPPPPPSFAEPEPVREEPAFNPFDQPQGGAMAQSEWTPPPVPNAGWQDPGMGQGVPPPPAPGASVNQTLPIVSLVFGIVSLCCYISPLTGIVALVTGFMGLKNVNRDPQHFGGKGLAIAGMITGGVFFLLGVLYWIYIIFVIGLAAMGNMGNF